MPPLSIVKFDMKLTQRGGSGLPAVQSDPCSRVESKPPGKATVTREDQHVFICFLYLDGI